MVCPSFEKPCFTSEISGIQNGESVVFFVLLCENQRSFLEALSHIISAIDIDGLSGDEAGFLT